MDASRFRGALLQRLVLAAGAALVPLAACGDDGDGSDDDGAGAGPSTGAGPYYEIRTQCFTWPMADNTGGAAAGGLGGMGGTGGVGGMAGQAGGVGGSGGSGGGAIAPCPDTSEARIIIGDVGPCGTRILEEAPEFDGAQCCYQVEVQYCLGRPFIEDGAARRSAPKWGVASDWCPPQRDEATVRLDGRRLRVLAEAWCADGLAEHASVASFARFALELMALAAPADLVASAHQAALDEVKHARACFALARRYGGRDVAPGAFPMGGSVEVSSDLVELAARVALEGCVGETVAAMQAAHQLEVARDPEVRRVLAMIAEDEARHAELAWRTISWALSLDGDAVRIAVVDAIESGIAAVLADDEALEFDAALCEHGRLDGATLRAVRLRAIDSVVRPCAAVVLAPSSALVTSARAAVT